MKESNSNIRFLSAVSYIGVLFIIGHFAVEKNHPDLRFHTFQGCVLFCLFSVLYFIDFLLYLILTPLPELQTILITLLTIGISIAYLMLTVMGIVSAVRYEQRVLPYVGRLSVALRGVIDHDRKKR